LISNSLNELKVKDKAVEFYDQRYLTGYMEEWDGLKKAKVKEVISLLELPKTGKALDFGCGNGVFTDIIKQVLPNWDVYGVEISPVAVKNATEKFPTCTFFGLDDVQSHLGSFDFLFSHHVIEHVQDIRETFDIVNGYLKEKSSQLHILPCGNENSFEYNICVLKKNGIEYENGKRFFFEEPGHLRRLNTEEFCTLEKGIGFLLKKEFYSNQYHGAIDWITKSSPRFVKTLTNDIYAIDETAGKSLKELRKKLLPLTYFQFAYSKYWAIKSKWHKKLIDYIKMGILFVPAMICKRTYDKLTNNSKQEWINRKTERNGSEMFLYFERV
jgi:SAM-dependent methyltransferase